MSAADMSDIDAVLSRRALMKSVPPALLAAGVLAACTPPEAEPVSEIMNPKMSLDDIRRLSRNVCSVFLREPGAEMPTQFVDVYWSHSCGDTMRFYRDHLRGYLQNLPKGTFVALHHVARHPPDVRACLALRSVDRSAYARATRAVLELGAERGNFVPTDTVIAKAAEFPRNGDGYSAGFAENSIRFMQQMVLKAGIVETPWVMVNGARRIASQLRS